MSTVAVEPAITITFPISVDYVSSWTLPRALAEAVANAIDADPEGFTVAYDDAAGELVITDTAAGGIGAEGVVFGWSDKRGRDTVIGQFGEGLKIATLRAVSDPAVTHMLIETVGATIRPHVAAGATAAIPLPSRTGAPAMRVLAWEFTPTTRRRGTVIRVGVSRDIADAVTGRFLHLTVPGYRPNQDGAILNAHPGKVYVGGVLVSEHPKLLFGYDLPLTFGKAEQNRDRTVIDPSSLARGIGMLHQASPDPDRYAVLARAALTQGLAAPERLAVARAGSAAERAAWAAATRTVLGDPRRYFYRPDASIDPGIVAALVDAGRTELTAPTLDPFQQRAFMGLLGVPAAKAPTAPRTVWAKNLTPTEQSALATAVAAMRRIYGPRIIDKVRVYESTRIDTLACPWDGFYTSTTGAIALGRTVLADPAALWGVLIHEAGHRAAHLGLLTGEPTEWGDRSRGFEATLGAMAALAIRAVPADAPLPVPPAPGCAPSTPNQPLVPASQTQVPGGRPCDTESSLGPDVRDLAQRAWARLQSSTPRLTLTGHARAHHVRPSDLSRLLNGTWGGRASYQSLADAATSLGLDPAVVWWATCGVMSQWCCRTENTVARGFTRECRSNAARAVAALADGPYAAHVPSLTALAEGTGPVVPSFTDDAWAAPIRALWTEYLASPEWEQPS